MRLKDKVAIVTGGASGIGKGIVECFAREGARVIIFDKDTVGAEKVSHALSTRGIWWFGVDVTQSNEIHRAVETSLSIFGKVDILVNNAGIEGRPGNPFTLNTEEEWDSVLQTNVKSVFLVSKEVVPHFQTRKYGRIINMSSIAGIMPGPMSPPYSVSKAAVITFTQILAQQLAKDGITVNALAPGLVWTPHWERLAKENIARYPEKFGHMTPRQVYENRISEIVPLRREQTPEDVGMAAVFLASDEARNTTGQVLQVDGGVVMR